MVPIIPRIKIINEEIVYSDTVLPLKEIGSNLKITVIENISEENLEDCLKSIFESNPHVSFNTVQYSKNDKKLYFYTSEEISTKEYEESKVKVFNKTVGIDETIKELDRVILEGKNKDEDAISLYDVAHLVKDINNEYEDTKNNYEDKLNSTLRDSINSDSIIAIHDIDFKEKKIKLSFREYSFMDFEEITFSLEDDDIRILNTDSHNASLVFPSISKTLKDMYDDLEAFSNFKDYQNSSINKEAINTDFNIDISHYGVSLYKKDFNDKKYVEFSSPSYSDKYKLNANSGKLNKAFDGFEDDIFKNVYIKIDDCPKWSRAMLKEIREDELKKEEIKDKVLGLSKKIFPFV